MNAGELKRMLENCNDEADVQIVFDSLTSEDSREKGFIEEVTYSQGFVQGSHLVEISAVPCWVLDEGM